MKIITLLILMCLTISAQDNFPRLNESDFNNCKMLKEKEYDGNSLWGHINGGADLYLEYGFDKLLLQEVEYEGIKFRIEFYRMNDAESAFGIFSINRFRCNLTDTLTQFICITENQIQTVLGRYYISISNEKETSEALKLSFELITKILGRNNKNLFQIPLVFTQNRLEFNLDYLKFIKGRLGFQNGFPQWESQFDGLNNYSLYILPVESDSGYFILTDIKFQNEKDLEKFLRLVNMPFIQVGEADAIIEEGQNREIKRISVSQLLYAESDYKTGILKETFSTGKK